MDRNWDIDHFKNEDLHKQVVFIHLCAYINRSNTGDEDGNPPTNHWAAFLELQGKGSVRLDMAPGYGSDGLRGKLDMSSKPYQSTNNAIRSVSFEVAKGVTVQTIVDNINQNGRQKYTFTVEWEGCRFWVRTLISDLEAEGVVGEGSGDSTLAAVS